MIDKGFLLSKLRGLTARLKPIIKLFNEISFGKKDPSKEGSYIKEILFHQIGMKQTGISKLDKLENH